MSAEPHSDRRGVERGGAIVLALALLPALWFTLAMFALAGLVSAKMPDPSVPSGDPCCSYPDTWSEVGVGLAFTLLFGIASAMVFWAMVALVCWGATLRWRRRRSWRIAPAIGATLAVLGFTASLVASANAREPTDCATYRFNPERFRSEDQDVRRSETVAMTDCQPLSDMTKAKVRSTLGAPPRVYTNRDFSLWYYRDLEVRFIDGRATDANAVPYIDR
jgi:hypothetical protein